MGRAGDRGWGGGGGGGDGAEQVVLGGGVDDGAAAGDVVQGAADLLGAGVFGQVAAGAGAERVDDRVVVGVGGEHDDLNIGAAVAELTGGGGAVQMGHAQIHQDHVGLGLLGQPECFLAVGGGPHHLDIGQQAQEHGQAFAHHPLVIGGQHPDG